jgi:hypothetical protein
MIRWRNGDIDNVVVPDSLRHGRDEEKVKYLPQKFVERLCAPENNRQLEDEIERVIFQRISRRSAWMPPISKNSSRLQRAVEMKRANFMHAIQALSRASPTLRPASRKDFEGE